MRCVDYNKVLHGSKLVEDLINYLKHDFGRLVVTKGKKHKFLGMNINIKEEKQFGIDIKEYLLEAMESFGENIDKKLTTPESSHLFIVNE